MLIRTRGNKFPTNWLCEGVRLAALCVCSNYIDDYDARSASIHAATLAWAIRPSSPNVEYANVPNTAANKSAIILIKVSVDVSLRRMKSCIKEQRHSAGSVPAEAKGPLSLLGAGLSLPLHSRRNESAEPTRASVIQ